MDAVIVRLRGRNRQFLPAVEAIIRCPPLQASLLTFLSNLSGPAFDSNTYDRMVRRQYNSGNRLFQHHGNRYPLSGGNLPYWCMYPIPCNRLPILVCPPFDRVDHSPIMDAGNVRRWGCVTPQRKLCPTPVSTRKESTWLPSGEVLRDARRRQARASNENTAQVKRGRRRDLANQLPWLR